MNTQKIIRKYKKNTKALSPVVASIILIAVTVAVSVVVAAWMSGSIFGLMGNTEQATITNLDLSTSTQVVASVQNTGNANITITAAYVNGVSATSVPALTNGVEIAKGATTSFTLTTTPALALEAGEQVTVKMTTSAGNNLLLTQIAP